MPKYFLYIIVIIIVIIFLTALFLVNNSSFINPSTSPSPTPITTYPTKPIPSSTIQQKDNNTACIQVITPAVSPQTGECREFPTPCDVPNGWRKVSSCNN